MKAHLDDGLGGSGRLRRRGASSSASGAFDPEAFGDVRHGALERLGERFQTRDQNHFQFGKRKVGGERRELGKVRHQVREGERCAELLLGEIHPDVELMHFDGGFEREPFGAPEKIRGDAERLRRARMGDERERKHLVRRPGRVRIDSFPIERFELSSAERKDASDAPERHDAEVLGAPDRKDRGPELSLARADGLLGLPKGSREKPKGRRPRSRAGFDQPEEVEPIERMRDCKGDRLLAVKTALFPGKIGRAVDGEDVLARAIVEAQPRFGRLQAVRRSAEKLDAERPLEVVDGVTRPRSGNAEALGCGVSLHIS